MAEEKHTHQYLNYVTKNQVATNPNYQMGVHFPLLGLKTFPSAMIGRVCSCKEIAWLKWGPREEMKELAKKWQMELKASLGVGSQSDRENKTPLANPPPSH